MELPVAPFERIMKSVGAKRVSLGAMKELAMEIEEIAKEISSEAVKYAEHAGRKTVMAEDIKLACRNWRK
jgi:histone H3/H4